MFEANNIRNYKKNKFHFVLICDEAGIVDAFRKIKESLRNGGDTFVSLIYSISGIYPNPLFEREIAILEKRFSHNLYTHTLIVEPEKYDLIQELIEAIINSNTSLEMQFLIFGDEEFVDFVTGILGYLDIDTFSIESKIN